MGVKEEGMFKGLVSNRELGMVGALEMKVAVFSRGSGLQHMAKAAQLQKANRGRCWENTSIGVQGKCQLGAKQSIGRERGRIRRFTVIRKSS